MSSREEIRTSHMVSGKGQAKQRFFQSEKSIQGKLEVQHDIEDILNFKQVKRNLVRPATNIDQSLDE